jgi:hypothetical protein
MGQQLKRSFGVQESYHECWQQRGSTTKLVILAHGFGDAAFMLQSHIQRSLWAGVSPLEQSNFHQNQVF